jgi:adenylate cyclase class IV
MRTFNAFICHVYDQLEIYNALAAKLDAAKYFDWNNESVQYNMRYRNMSDDQLEQEIRERLKRSEIVLAFTNPVMGRRDWVRWEIEQAQSSKTPIVAITRYKGGSKSAYVLKHSVAHVDTWRTQDVVDAIRRHAKAPMLQAPAIPEPTFMGPTPVSLPPVFEH